VSGDTIESRMMAFENLQGKTGYIRKELAQRVKMRRSPEVRLVYDKSIDENEKVEAILDQIREEREAKERSQAAAAALQVEEDENNPIEAPDF